MRPRSVTWATVLCLLLASPLAAASTAPVVQADVSGLHLEGPASVDGVLGSFQSTGGIDGSSSPLPSAATPTAPSGDPRLAPTDLRLQAGHLHIETDVQDQSGSPAVGQPRHATERIDLDAVLGHAPAARSPFLFFLAPIPGHPLPRIHADANSADLLATAQGGTEPPRRVATDRPALQGAAGAGAEVMGAHALQVQGDFQLMLWEWDLDLATAAHPDNHTLIQTGYAYAPTLPSTPEVAGHGPVDTWGDSQERQAFVTATDATLDVVLPDAAAARLVVQPVAAHVEGRLVLRHPHGWLTTSQGNAPLQDGDSLLGSLAALLTAPGAGPAPMLHLGVPAAGLRSADLGGQALAFSQGLDWPWEALVPAASIACVAGLGLALLLLRRRGRAAAAARQHLGQGQQPTWTAPTDEDQLRVLRWLDGQHGKEPGAMRWDSDVMRAFEWPAERAQGTLRYLEARGHVRYREVTMPGGHVSLGALAITRSGWERIRGNGPLGGKAARVLLRTGVPFLFLHRP